MQNSGKHFRKYLIFVLIAAVAFCAAACKKTLDDAQSTILPEAQETPQTDNADTFAEEKPPAIEGGTYLVGTDLPTGEYRLAVTDETVLNACFEVASDDSGEPESYICGDIFDTFVYVTVSDGQYLRFIDASAISVDAAGAISSNGGIYGGGMYRVGADIPAGKYELIPIDDVAAYGRYKISADSSHSLGSVIDKGMFDDVIGLSLEDGQYLTLAGAYFEQ